MSAAIVMQVPSNHTEVAETDEEVPTFALSGPVVRLTDDDGTTYLFLRLVTDVEGVTYTLPFYRSSGLRSGFGGLWFPCVEVEEDGHVVKGTPPSIQRFFDADSVMKDESFLERVCSRLGLFGMAALNTMSVDEFGAFQSRILRESRDNVEVAEALELATPLFLTQGSDLKAEVAEALADDNVRVASSRETLNRFLTGGVMIGGGRWRRVTKRR